MLNKEVNQIIDNLKGRRGYEEKRAQKLGFTSLYDYFEDKLKKQKLAIENEKAIAKQAVIQKQNKLSEKKCNCC